MLSNAGSSPASCTSLRAVGIEASIVNEYPSAAMRDNVPTMVSANSNTDWLR